LRTPEGEGKKRKKGKNDKKKIHWAPLILGGILFLSSFQKKKINFLYFLTRQGSKQELI
jgi:hypothetical protein